MKIALAQINPTVGDFAGNLALALAACERATTAGAELVILPELALCGYPPADLLEKTSFLEACRQSLVQLAAWTAEPGRPAVLTGAVLPSGVGEGKLTRNVAVLLQNGAVLAVQQKMLLPFYDVFDEQRYFEPAEHQELTMLNGQPLAVTICEDAWNDKGFWPRRNYSVDPVEELMRQWATLPPIGPAAGPKLIVNLSASPYWTGKRQVRRDMLAAIAKRHGAWVAMVNQVGGNDSLIFDGSSIVIAPDGRVVQQAASFAEDLILFDTAAPLASLPTFVPHEDEIPAIWNALVLGVRDYMRKCGFRKAILGLSGGIDSALVAALAVDALGVENVMGIGMPSHYSSEGSVADARHLAENLGIRFEILPIAGVYDSFLKTLDPLFAGTPFGLAEENLQARTRGSLLMALSNKTGALVLTTGNKSEMSVGYCTLYGDMVGGLAVIGDVMKLRVYELSRYANRNREIIPLSTIEKAPSAELRPDQKDEDSLPPYSVLDPILEAYVERYETVEQIVASQHVDANLVRSVMKLVERSEYKRQQAAPVLKVTEKSFGNGRRFPIAVKYQS